MRQLIDVETTRGPLTMTKAIECNRCNAILWKADIPDHPPTPDYLEIEKKWTKHSKWNGQMHSFHICQKCYEHMIEHYFTLPVSAFK